MHVTKRLDWKKRKCWDCLSSTSLPTPACILLYKESTESLINGFYNYYFNFFSLCYRQFRLFKFYCSLDNTSSLLPGTQRVKWLIGWEDLTDLTWPRQQSSSLLLQHYGQAHRSRPSLWQVQWRLRTWSCSPDRQRASCPWHNRRSSSPRTLCGCGRWTSTCLEDNCWTSCTLFHTSTKAKMVSQKQVCIYFCKIV